MKLRLRQNKSGYSIVEIFLIIVALGIVGGTIYYVYNANKATAPDQTSKIIKKDQPTDIAKDPTADWKTYKDPGGLYEFKHPASWAFAESLDSCNPGLVLFGADKKSTGLCGTEGFGQMWVSASQGDLRSDYELTSTDYTGLSSEEVTVDGVKGVKQSGTFQPSEEVFVGSEPGDKALVYTFFKDGYTFYARYDIRKTNPYPDVQKDFEILVTKTLKLTP